MGLHTLATLAVPLVQARAWHRQVCRDRAGAAAMACLAHDSRCPPAESWVVVPTVGDTVVMRATTADDGDLVVKVALSPAAAQGLERHARLLEHLAGVDAVRDRVPGLVADGVLDRHRYVVERAAVGSPLAGGAAGDATADALVLMGEVHAATAHPAQVPATELHEAVRADLARLGPVARTGARQRIVAELGDALAAGLDARPPTTSVVHGDYWPGNVLAVGGPGPARPTAIVDWERASERGLPEVDLVRYLLDVHPAGFAAAVRASLAAPEATVGEWLATFGVPTLNPWIGRRLGTLLAWLGHVGAGLEATRRFGAGPLWVRTEVLTVLDLLAAHPGVLADLAGGDG